MGAQPKNKEKHIYMYIYVYIYISLSLSLFRRHRLVTAGGTFFRLASPSVAQEDQGRLRGVTLEALTRGLGRSARTAARAVAGLVDELKAESNH